MIELADSLGNKQFSASPTIFFGASVGKHFRHIVEFYQSFITGIPNSSINYDKRERNARIENEKDYCKAVILEIQNSLDLIASNDNKPVEVEYEYDGNIISSVSSTNRELIFCVEHCVHHLAILKLAIHAAFPEIEVSENLGVAHSTLQYQERLKKA